MKSRIGRSQIEDTELNRWHIKWDPVVADYVMWFDIEWISWHFCQLMKHQSILLRFIWVHLNFACSKFAVLPSLIASFSFGSRLITPPQIRRPDFRKIIASASGHSKSEIASASVEILLSILFMLSVVMRIDRMNAKTRNRHKGTVWSLCISRKCADFLLLLFPDFYNSLLTFFFVLSASNFWRKFSFSTFQTVFEMVSEQCECRTINNFLENYLPNEQKDKLKIFIFACNAFHVLIGLRLSFIGTILFWSLCFRAFLSVGDTKQHRRTHTERWNAKQRKLFRTKRQRSVSMERDVETITHLTK